MEYLIIFISLLYFISAAGYIAYFFVQKDFLQKYGAFVLLAGFLLHCVAIGYSYYRAGYLPVYALRDTLSIAAGAVAGVFLVFRYHFKIKILGVFAAPLAAVIMFSTLIMPGGGPGPERVFNSFWMVIHIISIFTGEAALALACGAGIFYIAQERAIKAKKTGFLFNRLPSLELIDTTSYGSIVVGFSMLTLGLISGIVYAKVVWGKFWSWDPKEIWSVVTWLIYAALLHGRLVSGWRGRRAAYMAVLGFAVLMFTFFGVNFFMQGHHGVFTKMP